MNNLTLEAWKEYVRRDGAGGYALASDYRGIAAKRRAETRLLSRAAGLDRGGGAGIERVKCYPRPLRKRERPEPPVGLDGVDDRVGIP